MKTKHKNERVLTIQETVVFHKTDEPTDKVKCKLKTFAKKIIVVLAFFSHSSQVTKGTKELFHVPLITYRVHGTI
jgi:hypothetical protein